MMSVASSSSSCMIGVSQLLPAMRALGEMGVVMIALLLLLLLLLLFFSCFPAFDLGCGEYVISTFQKSMHNL